jgi:sulfide:quinone oxidoreductase
MNTAMTGEKTALVLGGGVGGLIAANRLRRLLAGKKYRVVLAERQPNHLFQPSLLWLAVGDRQPGRIQRPLRRLLRKGIEVVTAEVAEIDPVTRTVRAGGRELAGDAMIVSLGAELASDSIPGLAGAGHNLYTIEGATAFRDALASLRSGRIVVLTATPAYKCPAAPYEAAMLIEAALRRRSIRPHVSVDIYAAEPGPMGVTGPKVSAAVRQIVESKHRLPPGAPVTTVEPASRRLVSRTSAEFDLLYVPFIAPAVGVRPGSSTIRASLLTAPRSRHASRASSPSVT